MKNWPKVSFEFGGSKSMEMAKVTKVEQSSRISTISDRVQGAR